MLCSVGPFTFDGSPLRARQARRLALAWTADKHQRRLLCLYHTSTGSGEDYRYPSLPSLRRTKRKKGLEGARRVLLLFKSAQTNRTRKPRNGASSQEAGAWVLETQKRVVCSPENNRGSSCLSKRLFLLKRHLASCQAVARPSSRPAFPFPGPSPVLLPMLLLRAHVTGRHLHREASFSVPDAPASTPAPAFQARCAAAARCCAAAHNRRAADAGDAVVSVMASPRPPLSAVGANLDPPPWLIKPAREAVAAGRGPPMSPPEAWDSPPLLLRCAA